MKPALSLVLPTFNEAANVRTLVPALFRTLRTIGPVEVIVVDDDSPDGTARVVRSLQARYPQLRLIVRKERGLSSAVLAGFAVARAPVLGAMDADHSHPPSALPKLYRAIQGGADVAIGSRLVRGGRIQNFPAHRMLISRGAALLARPLTPIKDPMSGYFLARRSLLESHDAGRRSAGKPASKSTRLNPRGFKVLLELVVKTRPRRVVEVPITFRVRAHGHSKLGSRQILDYVLQVCNLYAFRLRSRAPAGIKE